VLRETGIDRSTAALYRAEPVDNCVMRCVEGLALLYHRPSGSTHLLDSPVPEILELLAAGPCDAAMLTRHLCERLDLAEDEEALMVVSARLGELAGIGLVSIA
jgi:PqqD family protein of HPr-rel-A system